MGGSQGSSSSPIPAPGEGDRDARRCEGGCWMGCHLPLRGVGRLEMSKGKAEVAKQLSTCGCPGGGGWLWYPGSWQGQELQRGI